MSQIVPNSTESIDLPYEIETLREAYRLLPEYGAKDHHLRNFLIEGFWLHARNLIEMFLGKRNAIDPNEVASPDYAPGHPADLANWYKVICNQISHLQGRRPVEQSKKLNSRDPKFVKLIEAEIANFLAHLPPGRSPILLTCRLP